MGRGDPRPGAGRPLGAVARASIAMFAKKPLGLAKPSGWGFMMRTDNQVLIYLLTALLVSSLSTARAEDNCLLKPEAPAPQGSRWYYRTDPTSQNKCWHLRTEGQTSQQPIQQEKPVRPDERGKARSPAAADFPLPRSAPKEARQQRSTAEQTGLAPSPVSGGMVNPGTAQGVELRGGLGGDTVVPPAPSTKTNVSDDAPTKNVTGSASSSKASDDALAQPGAQLPAAADNEARGEAPPDEKQRVDHLTAQILENKNNQAEKEITAGNSKSGAKSSLAVLFIIVAGFIVCGILIYSLLIVRFARRHEAAAIGGLGSVLPAQAEKTETNDHTQNALQELIQLLGPYEAPRLATIRQVKN